MTDGGSWTIPNPALPNAVCGCNFRVYAVSFTAFWSRSSFATGHIGLMSWRKSGWIGLARRSGRRNGAFGAIQSGGGFGGSGLSGIRNLRRALILDANDIPASFLSLLCSETPSTAHFCFRASKNHFLLRLICLKSRSLREKDRRSTFDKRKKFTSLFNSGDSIREAFGRRCGRVQR